MDDTLNPSSRPRRGVLAVLGGGIATALVGGAIVLSGGSSAAASGLSTFTSCDELREWGADAITNQSTQFGADVQFDAVGAPIASDGDVAAESSAAGSGAAPTSPGPATTVAAEMAATDDGGPVSDSTNVIVEGIDEPDLVERLGGDRALVVGGQTLAIADLAGASVEAATRVPWGAQITYDADAGVAWSVGYGDRGETLVQRFVVAEGSITEDGSWSTTGQLVSARRQGGELLLVATDGFYGPVAFEDVGGPIGGETSGEVAPDGGDDVVESQTSIPFEEGPVPCDQVLHPEGPAEPSSTLIVVLPVDGPLEPVRSTQVVGAGTNVHVTSDAAYIATPSWDPADGTQTTGLHRFELGSLTHTGSGAVEGSLLNDFALSEHDGHLRVAVTVGGGFMGVPMPIDPGIGDGSTGVTEPAFEDPVLDGPAESPMVDDPGVAPDASVSSSTEVTTETTGAPDPAPDVAPVDPAAGGPETTVPDGSGGGGAAASSGVPANVVAPEPMPVDPMPMPTVVGPDPDLPVINEIVVLDTDGALDVVGRTPRFGHPGESLQGIRFEGNIAYAVTFLQTDPFYVVDLSDPADPVILGELELPGFSAYLHPISATEVVGFGPDESGRASAKLFDVSDRSNPRIVDSIVLGDESAVVWDHHAFTSLGDDRFAVPASQWSSYIEPACEACPGGEVVSSENHVVVLAVSGGRLVEEDRISVSLPESIMRVIPASDGWGLLATSSLTVVDSSGTVRGTVPLG